MSRIYVQGIGTATPEYEGHQKFVDYAVSRLETPTQKKLLQKIVRQSAIEKRYSVLSPSPLPGELDNEGFYVPAAYPTTQRRMEVYEDRALPLVKKALQNLSRHCDLKKVTHLIVTTCTGFYAPGIDIQIVETLGLPPQTERILLGFMGCFAAVPALRTAHQIIQAQPEAQVLTVNIELCTLHLKESFEFEDLLSFLIFADGCAATLVTAEKSPLELTGFSNDVVVEYRDRITWKIGNSGFDMGLSPKTSLAVKDYLTQRKDDFERHPLFAIHPGGQGILNAVQEGLGLAEEQMTSSRTILRNFGNMSSPSIMFVLKDILYDTALSGAGHGMAFGPGFSVEKFQFKKQPL